MRVINNPQVNKQHYSFNVYASERRFLSYYHQVKNIMYFIESRNATRILIVGKGDGVVQKILEAYSELSNLKLIIKTFDFAEDLHPDILGDLIQINKLVTEKFDVILCCQVLEHLPIEEAFLALDQMQQISKYIIMSVPYKTITIRGTIKVPLLKEFEFCIKVPIWHQKKKGMVDTRHYWELGFSKSVRDFKKELNTIGFNILLSYTLIKDGFKHFLILESGKFIYE